MYLPINAQKELMSIIVNAISQDRKITSSGIYDRNSPCLNELFVVDGLEKYFVVYAPNATDNFGDEHFGDIALEIIVNDEVEFLDHDITSVYRLLDVLEEQLGVVEF